MFLFSFSPGNIVCLFKEGKKCFRENRKYGMQKKTQESRESYGMGEVLWLLMGSSGWCNDGAIKVDKWGGWRRQNWDFYRDPSLETCKELGFGRGMNMMIRSSAQWLGSKVGESWKLHASVLLSIRICTLKLMDVEGTKGGCSNRKQIFLFKHSADKMFFVIKLFICSISSLQSSPSPFSRTVWFTGSVHRRRNDY